MKLLEDILRKITLSESVDIKEVEDAIDKHNRVIINYHSKGEDNNTGARVIEVYAYGLTKAGNPVIRAWQPYGDTTSRVPSWKFFRLDRISEWQPTKQVFSHPADFYYKGYGNFNPNGDETMSIVYKIAKFGDDFNAESQNVSEPKTKEDVYKTETEKRMERFKQHSDNPITISDVKDNDTFKDLSKNTNGPKTKEDVYKPYDDTGTKNGRESKSSEEMKKDLDKLRKVLGDKQMTLGDLGRKMKEETPEDEPKWKRVFSDEAERDLKQMQRNNNDILRRRDNRWQKSADTRSLNRKGSLNRAFD